MSSIGKKADTDLVAVVGISHGGSVALELALTGLKV